MNMPLKRTFKKDQIKGFNLNHLISCKNCEKNTITMRINHNNVCSDPACVKAAQDDVFRLPDPQCSFKVD